MTLNTSSDAPSTRRRRWHFWPVLVAALLFGHAGLMIAAVSLAVGGSGRGVVEDYYAKAMDFDTYKSELQASADLGWHLTLTPGSMVDKKGRRVLMAEVFNADQMPLADAHVSLRYQHLAQGEHSQATLQSGEAGTAQGLVSMPYSGLYRMEAVVDWQGKRFIESRELYVPGAGGEAL